MNRQLLALLCTASTMHAMQTPQSESSARTAPHAQGNVLDNDFDNVRLEYAQLLVAKK